MGHEIAGVIIGGAVQISRFPRAGISGNSIYIDEMGMSA
jgi:hypothetical protein